MKYLAIFSLVFLAACYEDTSSIQSENGRTFHVECIDGVEYWHRNANSRSSMSPRIDPNTLTFVRCQTKTGNNVTR